MQCPRCGFDQPASEECIACGVVISKYLATVDELAGAVSESPSPDDDDPFAGLSFGEEVAPDTGGGAFQLAPTTGGGHPYAEPPPGFPPPDADPFPSRPIHEAEELANPAIPTLPGAPSRPPGGFGAAPAHRIAALDFGANGDLHIGGVAAALRIVAAFGCLGLAIIMIKNGEGLRSAWPYAVMVFYGAGALWGLLTARHDITVRQFGIEMAVLGVLTLGLRLASPETFAVDSHTASPAPVASARLPDTPLGHFTQRSLAFLDATQTVLDAKAPLTREQWTALAERLDFEALKSAYDLLDTEARARIFDIWKRLNDFGPIVASMLERYMVDDAGGGVRLEIPEVERRAVGGELPDTIARLRRVQERISEVEEPVRKRQP
ncbi:MAG: hypothetical protein H6744_04810 [Deltaproteobacteria bacterium]|nr:hypothetical protein [Deltaproteobacteria bacterium]MCB9785997.1 hypothetical protein [Deltaproteobacteria bacterium]